MSVAAVSLALVALVVALWVLIRRRRELLALTIIRPAPLTEPLLVIVPARDEGDIIEAALWRLLREPSPDLRVIVVDDGSTDDTAAIVERAAQNDLRAMAAGDAASVELDDAPAMKHAPRLRLLRLTSEPPAGTFGKPHALETAVEDARARGELPERILFVDADVLLEDGCLGGLVQAMSREGIAALSGLPRLVCRSAVEQLLVPTLQAIITSRHPPSRVHDGLTGTAYLSGQLLLVDRQAYDEAGGWRAVSHAVREDVALARRMKGVGRKLRLGNLRALAKTHHDDSFDAIADGFGKNAVALLGRRAAVVGVLAFLQSLLPVAAVVLALLAADELTPIALGLVAIALLLQLWARRVGRMAVWPVLVLPLVYLGVAFVLVRASVRFWRRVDTTWKGRPYPLG